MQFGNMQYSKINDASKCGWMRRAGYRKVSDEFQNKRLRILCFCNGSPDFGNPFLTRIRSAWCFDSPSVCGEFRKQWKARLRVVLRVTDSVDNRNTEWIESAGSTLISPQQSASIFGDEGVVAFKKFNDRVMILAPRDKSALAC